jgi:hypothetical protein
MILSLQLLVSADGSAPRSLVVMLCCTPVESDSFGFEQIAGRPAVAN